MKRSYMTTMPDKSGAFLKASRIILAHGGNITRCNYNKAVDTHTLFVDVEADEAAQSAIQQELEQAGYFAQSAPHAKVVLTEFELLDRPGAVLPILEVLGRHNINISYISSQENGSGKQFFKMGLYIDEPSVIENLLRELSTLCPVRILQYDAGEKNLDNTVFYISFAGEMRRLLGLSQEQTNDFIFNANLVMQQLDERSELPAKTFDYISKFAHFVAEHSNEAYTTRLSIMPLSLRVNCTVLEPPCGSNITVLEDLPTGDLLVVDGGFACHMRTAHRRLQELFPDFDTRKKELLLTHADYDHAGLAPLFDVIHVSRRTAQCFHDETTGGLHLREHNRKTLPYSRLSRIITRYEIPQVRKLHVLDTIPCDDAQPLSPIGSFSFADMDFTVYQGNGGHLPGEIVLLDEKHRVALTGDDYVNINGYTPEQKAFNRLAPYLMTSVNEDSARYKAILGQLRSLLGGHGWIILPGHGAIVGRDDPM